MTNLDMHIASFISDTSYDLQDTYSFTEALPDNDIFLGGSFDLSFISYKKNTNGHVLTYSRQLETKDQYDYTFVKGQGVLMNIVWGRENYPVYHQSNVYSTALTIDPLTNAITFVSGFTRTTPISPPVLDVRATFEAHGIILMISWGLSFFGIIAARFFRHKSAWIWIHGIAMGIPTAATLALSIVAIIVTTQNSNEEVKLKPHHIIGFVMMGVVFIQFLNGLFTWFKVYRNALSGVQMQSNLNMRWFHRVYIFLI